MKRQPGINRAFSSSSVWIQLALPRQLAGRRDYYNVSDYSARPQICQIGPNIYLVIHIVDQKSGRVDLNHRPREPKSRALTGLRHAPNAKDPIPEYIVKQANRQTMILRICLIYLFIRSRQRIAQQRLALGAGQDDFERAGAGGDLGVERPVWGDVQRANGGRADGGRQTVRG
jgi:hypothetical protein